MACKVEGPVASTYAGGGVFPSFTDSAKNQDAAKNPPRTNLPPMYPGPVGPDHMNPMFGTQPFSNNENDDIPFAFKTWRDHWGRIYATREEEEDALENFEENYLVQLRIHLPTCPLWMVLGHNADRPYKEHFNYIRLDWGIDSDDDDDPPRNDAYPVLEKDRTVRWVPSPRNPVGDLRTFVLGERRRLRGLKDDTKELATVKHQSTLLPVKRTSDDKGGTKEEDQDKRPKIGCGGQKQGCCSDCGK